MLCDFHDVNSLVRLGIQIGISKGIPCEIVESGLVLRLKKWHIKANIIVMDMPILDTRKYKDGIEQLVSDIVLQLLSYFAEQTKSPETAGLSQPYPMDQTVAAEGFPISGLANCPKKC